MQIKRVSIPILMASAAIALAIPAAAQDAQGEGFEAYSDAFFARFQTTNAYDMLILVPGFRLEQGDSDLRGYSSAAGNLLVNGQRPSSKAETLEDLLKRIPASQVAQIELIRAGTSGYDMQGYPLLANIVLKGTSRLSGRIEGQYAVYRHGYRAPKGSAQVNFNANDHVLNLSVSAFREIDDEHGFGTRNRYDDDGEAIRLVDYAQPEGTDVLEAMLAYNQPLLGGTIKLDGLAQDERMFAHILYDITYPDAEIISGEERNHTRTYEGSARFERPLGADNSIELIGSYRKVRKIGSEEQTEQGFTDRTDEISNSSEKILRGAFRHARGSFTLESGVEGAINVLESSNQLFENGTEVPLPRSSVTVTENRAEFFSTAGWALGPGIRTEAGLRYEISRLSQSGDTDVSKSLAYLKPRLRLNWTPDPQGEFRLMFEREVGQLDFSDFVGAASLNSGTVTSGNEDLEPETLWRAELAYERRLGAASLVLTARREWISDLVDQMPIVTDGELYDSVGNIGSARRDEIEASLKLPLSLIGLNGVMVVGDMTARRSRVTDPSTGLRRRISGDSPFEGEITITHDLPRLHMRWGGTFAAAEKETNFKVSEVETEKLGGRLDLFAEYKPDPKWTFRIFGKNLTDSAAIRSRDLYDGRRGSSAFSFREDRILRSGRYFGLTVQRNF